MTGTTILDAEFSELHALLTKKKVPDDIIAIAKSAFVAGATSVMNMLGKPANDNDIVRRQYMLTKYHSDLANYIQENQ